VFTWGGMPLLSSRLVVVIVAGGLILIKVLLVGTINNNSNDSVNYKNSYDYFIISNSPNVSLYKVKIYK
jgi:hypothetical protein